jgi:hypothetical protein
MRANAFVVSATLMFAAIIFPAFINPHDPVWKKLIVRLAWIMFVIGLIGCIISCGSWPHDMPIPGGE